MRVLMIHVVRDHLLLGALVAALLAPGQGVAWAVAFWAASVLVDVDHHLHFLQFAGWRRWLDFRGMFRFNAHPHCQGGGGAGLIPEGIGLLNRGAPGSCLW